MSLPTLATCRIVVINDIFGTREEVDSPQSPKEVMRNHGQVRLAMDWIKYHQPNHLPLEKLVGFRPIAVSVQRTADAVIVHWHLNGDDPETAQDTMRKYFDGTWREEGELL